MSMTEQERREYRDYMVSVHAAKDAWDTAVDEAKAKGWEKGRADEKVDTARKMKAKGFATIGHCRNNQPHCRRDRPQTLDIIG